MPNDVSPNAEVELEAANGPADEEQNDEPVEIPAVDEPLITEYEPEV